MPRPRKPDPVKHCLFCGEQYFRKYHPSGRLTRRLDFFTSSYCSRQCTVHAIALGRRQLREALRKGATA